MDKILISMECFVHTVTINSQYVRTASFSVRVRRYAVSPHPRTTPNSFTAIDMATWRQRDEGFSGETDLAYGRFSTLVASARAGVKDGAFDFAAGSTYRYSEGKREHNMAELKNAFARTGVELTKTDYITFIYRRAESKVQDPGVKDKPTPIRDQFNTDMDSYAIRLKSEREWMKGHSLVYITDGRIRWHKDHISDTNPSSPYGWSKTDWQTWGCRSLYGYAVRLLSRRQMDVHSFRRHALSLHERSPRRMGSVHGNHLRHRRVRRLRIVCTGSPLSGARLPSKHDRMGQNRHREYLQPPLRILSRLRNAGHNGLRRLETQVLTGKTKRQEGIAIRIER